MTEQFLKQIEAIVTRSGYECVHVAIRSEFGRMKVQILIDTLGGINVDDCETVSRHVNKFLDENPDMPEINRGRYYLEVSSPGIERPLYTLNDYERFQGREARVRLNGLLEGRKTFTGVINSVDDGQINLLCDTGEKRIPFEIIKGGNLIYRFENENENENDPNKRKNKRKGSRKK
ncbi:MAG: ribosome maturation factor RimP [Synergistales bacterium]|nr:ribosome maturation factor RimP [Synergistales bacterium]MDY6402025.1 ribosome maturation factor RimP [Synergistales bacterium]MDY6404200.1 ribosome maturation factor RimP [Synergistales bacterium]MDY6411154.1 ribosome maturation factor RimP [Synergistales bacterium]MDY6413957.1 ribosome maturation factor RimP [Synergistales bacterium]